MKNPFLNDEKTQQEDKVMTEETTPHVKEEPLATIDPPSSSSSSPAPVPIPPHKPNKGRLVVRFWQAMAAVGAFGFQICASAYSGVGFLFDDAKLQYYTYAIDFISFVWALFMIYVYLTRRFSMNDKATKVKRPIAFAVDTALAALFGIASFYQFASYPCPPGQYNGWCHFHNTGRFFLVSLFLSYTIMMCWDLFGGCTCLRKKRQIIE